MKNSGKKASAAPATTAPEHLPPLLHRRWVEFLILRGESNERAHKFLRDDNLPTPSSDVLDAMRASLVVPRGFKPQSKVHAPTRAFLEKRGLVEVFDFTPELQQALRVLRAPRPRELVEASILGGVPARVVVQMLAQLFGIQVGADALRVYRELFFDVDTVGRGPLRVLLEERLRQGIRDVAPRMDEKDVRRIVASDPRLMALAMPCSEISWASVLMRLGWTPPRQELAAIIGQLESLSSVRLGQALLRGGPQDDRRAESCAGVLERVRTIKQMVAAPDDELHKKLQQLRLVHSTERTVTADELRDRGDDVTVDNMPPTTTAWNRAGD